LVKTVVSDKADDRAHEKQWAVRRSYLLKSTAIFYCFLWKKVFQGRFFVPKPLSAFIELEKSSNICFNKRRIEWEIDLPSSGNKVFKYKGLEFW